MKSQNYENSFRKSSAVARKNGAYARKNNADERRLKTREGVTTTDTLKLSHILSLAQPRHSGGDRSHLNYARRYDQPDRPGFSPTNLSMGRLRDEARGDMGSALKFPLVRFETRVSIAASIGLRNVSGQPD
ncbi:hypothetical protein CABS02_15125 [Colletotrichum abscissum]|uniref:Uncharacterized protein n=2 Tax=Colletotrichum acutatum species complex TaxID=2707335 RepID=A0A9P9WZZ1_9PEZI|nr:hypothetical protein CABS02_15125 [Colletotrichum abscissum]KAK0369331.1 hypothetical protein CLIM01_13307 [Colletotrichum limetticola]